MKINSIEIITSGFVECKSCFYSVHDTITIPTQFKFNTGAHLLTGEIDSGIFAISYLISMKSQVKKYAIILDPVEVKINGKESTLEELEKYACYIDKSNKNFSKKKTIREQIEENIKERNLNMTAEQIRDMFFITDFRFENPITAVGNERLQAMAAIGFSQGKQIFCFPWLSHSRFEGYAIRMEKLFEIFKKIGAIAIVPKGYDMMKAVYGKTSFFSENLS
ncbi:MAG: hypothetical protein J6K52_04010 [Clostridia bacterium]|nr:hypothetical protein [Clostridia bacterium]